MSKIFSLAALTALAVATFEANPAASKVYATADGNIFLVENYARNHGRQEKLEVYPITRAEALAGVPADDDSEDDNADSKSSSDAASSKGTQGSEGAADTGVKAKATPAKKTAAAKAAPAKKPAAAKATAAKKADAPAVAPADASAGKPEEAAQ